MKYEISEAVRRTFANKFLKWGILLRDTVLDGSSSNIINKEEWQIKFIKDNNENGEYLEFYAKHHDYHDLHFRIYYNGKEEELEALTDGYDYNPSLPGDKSLQRQTYVANNKRVYESLKLVGLHM